MVTTDPAESEIRRLTRPDVNDPPNIKHLPFDGEQYVPWFAAGQPHGRKPPLMPHPMQSRAMAADRCWFCGRLRGSRATFLLTLTAALNRETFDLPAHWACAQYAATVWLPGGRLGRFFAPEDRRLVWLADPDDDWRGRLPAEPVCLWATDSFVVRARSIGIGEPVKTRWFCDGSEMITLDVTCDPTDLARVALVERLRPWLP